jgi:hypothetical protein
MKRSHKAAIAVLIVNAVLLISLGASWLSYAGLSNKLPSQLEAERFGGNKGFAQVSAYFPADNGIAYEQILSLRSSLEDKLEKQSVEPLMTEALLYVDGFSTRIPAMTVTGLRGNSLANVVAVGGDFFAFHPFDLIAGNYFNDDDILHDRIVIDDKAAWYLFGSNNVAGLVVTINGDLYKIAGVVHVEDDEESQQAYKLSFNNSNPVIFVPYEILENGSAESVIKFTTYEFVTQNLFSTFVEGLLKDESTLSAAEVKMNTGRFGIANIYGVLTKFAERSIRTNNIIYPYWENAARLIENKLAIKLVLMIALAVIPLLSFLFLLGWLLKNTKGKGKVTLEFFSDRLDFYRKWKWKNDLKKAERLQEALIETSELEELAEPLWQEKTPDDVIEEIRSAAEAAVDNNGNNDNAEK